MGGDDDTDYWRMPDGTVAIDVVGMVFRHGHLAADGEVPRADTGKFCGLCPLIDRQGVAPEVVDQAAGKII